MRQFFWDTETFLIEPGLAAPPLVCLQYAYDNDAPRIVLKKDAEPILREALEADDVAFVAWNGAFDYAGVCAAFPKLTPLVFRMLANKRGRDLMVREVFNHIRRGLLELSKTRGYFTLGQAAERHLDRTLDKGEDSWRLRYAELDGVEVEAWPPEAREYAEADITTLQGLSATPSFADRYEDEWMQVFSAFALHLAAVWGVRVDGARLDALQTSLEAEQVALREALVKSGLMDETGTLKTAVAQDLIVRACEDKGLPVPRTPPTKRAPEGNIKTDKATIEAIAEIVPELKTRVKYKAIEKVLSTYLLPMKSGVTRAMNSRPNVLVSSGRTSWGGSTLTLPDGTEHVEGTNLQNFPRVGNVRDCIVPRPGRLWLSVDFSALELRTLAQACLWICDRSVLARGFNENDEYDPYTEFAAQLGHIPKEEAYRLLHTDKAFKKGPRQRAKAAELGFPGGLGAAKFQIYAKGYGLELTLKECYALKDAWFARYPEMRGYFDYVDYLVNAGGEFRQFVSNRVRGGTGFSDGANTFFQGLAADGMKMALCAVSMACYAEPASPLFGSRVVAMIHDELCLEVPIESAHEAAMETVRLMEREMQKVTPDVKQKAIPALSTAWLKEAEPKYVEGRLVAYA